MLESSGSDKIRPANWNSVAQILTAEPQRAQSFYQVLHFLLHFIRNYVQYYWSILMYWWGLLVYRQTGLPVIRHTAYAES